MQATGKNKLYSSWTKSWQTLKFTRRHFPTLLVQITLVRRSDTAQNIKPRLSGERNPIPSTQGYYTFGFLLSKYAFKLVRHRILQEQNMPDTTPGSNWKNIGLGLADKKLRTSTTTDKWPNDLISYYSYIDQEAKSTSIFIFPFENNGIKMSKQKRWRNTYFHIRLGTFNREQKQESAKYRLPWEKPPVHARLIPYLQWRSKRWFPQREAPPWRKKWCKVSITLMRRCSSLKNRMVRPTKNATQTGIKFHRSDVVFQ